MPRRRRSTYSENLAKLLKVSESVGVQKPTRKRSTEPRHVIRSNDPFDPILYRQLVASELRAEVSEEQAILGHKFNLIEQEQKHKHRVQEDIFDEENKFRREILKRQLDAKETDAEIRSKESLIKLRTAQEEEIVSKPAAAQWKAMIEKLQEGQKQQGRLELEVLKHKQTINLEGFRQQNKERLAVLKESLKPPKLPKETVFEELERLKNTGAVRTVGDVMKFWFGKKKKKEEIEVFAKMEMTAAGIPFQEVFKSEAGLYESEEDKKKAWQKLWVVPLRRPEADQEATQVMRQFPSRFQAERFLRNQVRSLMEASPNEEEATSIRSDELEYLKRIAKQFPDEVSVYHQLQTEPSDVLRPNLAEAAESAEYAVGKLVTEFTTDSPQDKALKGRLRQFFTGRGGKGRERLNKLLSGSLFSEEEE